MKTDRNASGVVRGIAYRPAKGEAMRLLEECHVAVDRGLEQENRSPGKRGMTLLSSQSWSDTCAEFNADIPWQTRRANLLVERIDLASTIGRPVQIGPVRLWIHGETKPCRLMDELHEGLRGALAPACRGGVFGQVLVAGTIRIGDPVLPDVPQF